MEKLCIINERSYWQSNINDWISTVLKLTVEMVVKLNWGKNSLFIDKLLIIGKAIY